MTVLLGTNPSSFDMETPAQRRDRMEEVADSIDWASDGDLRRQAALLAVGQHETYWAAYTETCLEIPKGAPDCDQKQARGYWQAWKVSCPSGWRMEPGSHEALLAFADCADAHFWSAYRRCRGRHPAGDIAGAFSGYRGASCTRKSAAKKAGTFARKVQLLEQLARESDPEGRASLPLGPAWGAPFAGELLPGVQGHLGQHLPHDPLVPLQLLVVDEHLASGPSQLRVEVWH